jgi:phospholipase/carboxylesterase
VKVATAPLLLALVGLTWPRPVAAEPPAPPAPIPKSAALIGNPRSRLMTYEIGQRKLPVVLLHGYGSAPKDWFPFIETIKLPPGGRFVFPAAPEPTLPPEGPVGGLGWWRLRLDTHVPPGAKLPDLSHAHPDGLTRAAGTVRLLLDEVERRLRVRPPTAILGGFSQGAMVAAEIAFRSDVPLRALVLLSGTIVDGPGWRAAMPHRRGLPVFIAHGRQDDILPFDASERLQADMQQAGLVVTWVPFDGGHEIPAPIVDKLNEFLAKL